MPTITLRLSSKTDKATSQHEILMRFRHGRVDQYAKTNVFVHPDYWNDDNQNIVIPNWRLLTNEKKQLQDELRSKSDRLHKLKSFVGSSFQTIDKSNVAKDWLKNLIHDYNFPIVEKPDTTLPQTLLQAVDEFILKLPNRIQQRGANKGRPVSKRTILQYQRTKTTLKEFFEQSDSRDIAIDLVNQTFYDNYVSFLYRNGYKLNTVGKHIKNIKAVINDLPRNLRIMCEFVTEKKCVKLSEDVDNIYLTEDELRKIAELPIQETYLDRVRDQFILLAWTGCRYSDLGKLNTKNIEVTKNGIRIFKIMQQKTHAKVPIPIFPITEMILRKYDNNPPKVISNQKFNEFLKIIAKRAGLTDEVTITRTQMDNTSQDKTGEIKGVAQHFEKWQCVSAHTARRSFATNMYKLNLPTLSIMKITGHKTEKAFLTYIKISEDEHAERAAEMFAQHYNGLKTLPSAT